MTAMVACGSCVMFQRRATGKVTFGRPGSKAGRGDSVRLLALGSGRIPSRARTVSGKEVVDVDMTNKEVGIAARENHDTDIGVGGLQSLDEVGEVRLNVEVEKIDAREGVINNDVHDPRRSGRL